MQLLNTLYVTLPESYVHLDNNTVRLEVEHETRLRVPLHHLGAVVCFGQVSVSLPLMHRLAEDGVALVLLDANGEDGVILGAVYSDVDKPPFSDKNVRGTKYADGAEFSYNRATHTLTVKGGIERVVIEVAVGISLKGKTIDLTADTTTVNGNLEINGNAHSTGSMLSDGPNSNHHSH